MTLLTLTLLGGFEARTASSTLLLGKKTQGLLTVLGTRPGHWQPRDRLATLLWSDVDVERSRHSVRQALFSLRRILPAGVLQTAGDRVALSADGLSVDVVEFERRATAADTESLAAAAQLYRGELLEGLQLRQPAFDDWLRAERQRLRTHALAALERLAAARREAGDMEGAAAALTRVLALDATREAAHRALVRLHLAAGRREMAWRQCQALEQALGDLGLRPDEETLRLRQEVVGTPATPERSTSGTAAILVVEDEAVTRAVLEGFLALAGYEVVAVSDGADALVELDRRRFDLVLTDIGMPSVDGLTLAEILTRKGVDTPLIFITGKAGDDLEVRGLELGAVDYLRKPIQKEILLLRVRNALR